MLECSKTEYITERVEVHLAPHIILCISERVRLLQHFQEKYVKVASQDYDEPNS
jgi:hypothetical protein